MDAKQLPARPKLEQYRKQAKELIKAFKSGDPIAVRRLQRDSAQSASKQKRDQPALTDAQFVIAREHGFASWPKFANHIKALTSRNSPVCDFELAADAIISGNLRALKYLLNRNPDLIRARSTRTHHATLLHYTSANGVEDFRQKTPKNIVAITDFLLNAGAEVDATADMYGGGATTLGLVVTSVHPFLAGVQNDLADILLKHGANINHPQGAGNGQPPINGCFANGRPEAAEHLAKRGARLDLEAAAGVGDLHAVQNFFTPGRELKKGATDYQLKSGFKWACAYGRIEVAKFLLRTNIDINALHRGETPLHWAAYSGNLQIVRLLLKHKARTDIKDQSFNGTPLGWALYAWGESKKSERAQYYPIVETLVAAGATIDPTWLNETDRGYPLDKMIANDDCMSKALAHPPGSLRKIYTDAENREERRTARASSCKVEPD